MLRILRVAVVGALWLGVWQLAVARTETSLDGYWQGFVEHNGAMLEMKVEFSSDPGGLKGIIDIPDLYIRSYTLANVRYQPPNLHFELPLSREPDKFECLHKGEFIEGSFAGRFYEGATRTAHLILWRLKAKSLAYKQEEVSFQNGQVKLAGTLMLPLKKGPHPAVVFFHGSGPQTRESYLRFFAELFAQHGIATLIFDKRGSGRSTGEIWYRTGDRFDDLTADALCGVQFLLGRPEINPRKIGLWGLSQGGWLAPLAASRSQDIAFLIVVSGGGVTPAEQEVYDDEIKLRDQGYPPAEVGEAVALLRLADDVIRGRQSWEKFEKARAEAQKKEWFALLDRYPVKLPKTDDIWHAGGAGMDFDPRPFWEHTTIPVLAIFGADDKSTPTDESVRRIDLALQKSGNRDHVIKVFPKADHAMLVSAPGADRADWQRPVSGWLDLMVSWLQKHTK